MAALAEGLQEVRMSEGEYLKTDFEPAADFVDGVVEERNVGEYDHSTWQDALQAWFRAHSPDWRLRARPEWRMRTGPTRYRVPDVAVTSMDGPADPVQTTPPVAVFEILSPDDRIRRVMVKLSDYERMGVRNVFLIDPDGPAFFRFQDGKLGSAQETEKLDGATGSVDWAAVQALFY